MSESFKICPICATPNHRNAAVCTTCGTDLSNVALTSRKIQAAAQTDTDYDFRYGETDLLEGSVSGRARWLTFITVIIVTALIAGVIGLAIGSGYFTPDSDANNAPIVLPTATASPTLHLITVTQGPPTVTYTFTPSPSFTPSITPTPGPCQIQIQTGGTLIGAVMNCGHRSMDVIPTVLEMNGMSDASQVRVGQILEIPWPTPTPDPNATATPAQSSRSSDGQEVADAGLQIDESIDAYAPTVTPTLPAGITWHQVQPEENIISIAYSYNADVKTLSELNREIDFARCDFGETYGGPECIVQLFQGQMLRVPAPTPTPTLSPTTDPNSTATPTPTATYNVPSAYSPADRQFFYKDELITLRWIPSATLNDGEAYSVDVVDLSTGESYTALTTDISFTIPLTWQGQTYARHEYQWTIGIVNQANPADVRQQTQPLIFVWEGLVEESD